MTSLSLGELLVALLWGGLVFASWLGWGALIARPVRPAAPLLWGFLPGIGAAGLALIGGALALARLVSPTCDAVLVAAGLVGLGFLFARPRGSRPRGALGKRRGPGAAGRIALALRVTTLAFLALSLLAALSPDWIDPCDDWLATFVYPKRLLETGTLIDPFHFRRLSTLGTPAFLQSLATAVAGARAVPLVDLGLGRVLLWCAALATAEALAPAAARLRREAFAMLVAFASLAFLTTNHSPVLIPAAWVLAMLGLALRGPDGAGDRFRDRVPLLLAAAALVGVRNNLLAFAGAFLVADSIARVRTPRDLGRAALAAARDLAFVTAGLGPWLVLSWVSSRTPFFPLVRGNFSFPAGLSASLGPAEWRAFMLDQTIAAKLVALVALASLAVLVKARARDALAIAASAVAAYLVTAALLTASDSVNIVRYGQAFVLPALAVLGLVFYAEGRAPRGGRAVAPWLAAGVLAWWLWAPVEMSLDTRRYTLSPWGLAGENFQRMARGASHALTGEPTPLVGGTPRDVRAAEAFLPRGAKVLSAVARPFLWDFSAHRISLLDCPGQASPPPGMPCFAGADTVVAYLRAQGFDYLAYTPHETPNCLYSRQKWQNLASSPRALWREWSPYLLDHFDRLDEMERRGMVVFANAEIKIVDLKVVAPRPPSPTR